MKKVTGFLNEVIAKCMWDNCLLYCRWDLPVTLAKQCAAKIHKLLIVESIFIKKLLTQY